MNLLLVDDDKFERDGLRFLLDKMNCPFSILEANNGANALEVLQANDIDIVITDIKMPILNGIDFLKQAKELKPDIVYLIYSGYDDFLYAKEAITLKVLDFLVKPVLEDEFYRVIKEAIKLVESKNLTKYNDVVHRALFDHSLQSNTDICGSMVLLESEEEFKADSLNDLYQCNHIFKILYISNHCCLILMDKLNELCLQKIHSKMNSLKYHYHMIVSDEFKNLSEYRQKYEQILLVAQKYLCLENGVTVYPKDYMEQGDIFDESLLDKYDLNNLLGNLKKHYTILPPSFKYAFIKKYNYLSNVMVERILQADIHELSSIIDEMKNTPGDLNVIGSVKEFIKKNYMQNISIEDIADSVYLSPSYLCTLFKKETNITLLGYLIQFRIDMAKKLLMKTHIKIVEIAGMVGYENPSYFNMIFKKMTGMTPSEYRKEHFR